MKVGYARVSTADQTVALQLDALRLAGCDQVREETASGANTARPVLDEVLRNLRAGDSLVVWKLDRLGRDVRHLLAIAEQLRAQRVHLVVTTMGVDTSTPAGQMFFTFFAAMAEYERDLLRERTLAGLAAARARGRAGGRPSKLTKAQVRTIRAMYAERQSDRQQWSVAEIARRQGVSRSTVYRVVRAAG